MSKFKIGDVVRLRHSKSEWNGLLAKIDSDHTGMYAMEYRVEPLSDRPDGYGRTKFYSNEAKMELAEETYSLDETTLLLNHAALLSEMVKNGDLNAAEDYLWVFADFLSEYKKLNDGN